MRYEYIEAFREQANEAYLREHPGASDYVLKQNFLKKLKEHEATMTKNLLNDAKEIGFNLEKSGYQRKTFEHPDFHTKVDIDVNVLNSSQRAAKQSFKEKASAVYYDVFWDQQKLYTKAREQYNIRDRNTKQFVSGLNSSNLNLQMDRFISSLQGNELNSQQKNALFAQYIDEAVSEYKSIEMPKNDEEGLQSFKKMFSLGYVFSVMDIGSVYKEITHEDIDPEIQRNWDKNKEEYRNVWQYYSGMMDKITNPLYSYLSDKEMVRFGDQLANNEDSVHFNNREIRIGTMYEFASLDKIQQYYGQVKSMHAATAGITKNKLDLDPERDIMFNEDGIIADDYHFALSLDAGKDVYIQRNGEDKFAVGSYTSGFQNIRSIYDVPNSKDVYKYSLNVLNKGTRWYLPSSDEYKNMRNILGKLSRGEGNEVELLKDLKTNMEKYEENYFLKNNKSDIAKERMECVNRIKLGIQTVSDAKNYEAIVNKLVRENQATNTNQTEKVNESEDDYEKYGEEATHDIDGFEIDLDKQPTQKSTEESNRHQMPLNELNEANTIEGSVNNNDIIENVNVNENIIDNNVKNN